MTKTVITTELIIIIEVRHLLIQKRLFSFWVIVWSRKLMVLTKNIKHKFLVNVRPFSSAKTRCISDHAKPTIRELNPEDIFLHVGTNDINSEKKPVKYQSQF